MSFLIQCCRREWGLTVEDRNIGDSRADRRLHAHLIRVVFALREQRHLLQLLALVAVSVLLVGFLLLSLLAHRGCRRLGIV